ncbi:MAG TPA: hypothetical protein VGL56_05535 [Fimbriimonadaceae bacterium]
MQPIPWDNLEQEARHLVSLNHSEVPSIVASYIFPDPEGKTIRIINVDSKAFPERSVVPIKFSPDPMERLFHTMFIAVVDPSGPAKLDPPKEWGRWSDAILVERRKSGRLVEA